MRIPAAMAGANRWFFDCGAFIFFGGIGLVKMPRAKNRRQVETKPILQSDDKLIFI
jgi:hypothetical protein